MASNPEHTTGIRGIMLDVLAWSRVAIVESAEVVASYQIGQFLIKYTDKALWLIEKSSQWSLPPPTKNEEKPLVASELTRPLPWVFFLPTLLILRLVRESFSVVAFLTGSQPIQPSHMVRFIQNWRRSLRAIKYHGIRNIRMKNQKKASKSEEEEKGFLDWIYSKMQGLLCYKVVRYSNGKQPKALQDRRNSGERIVVCENVTKNKKRPLSADDDDDIDKMFDADRALRELASKIDLLPESDSDDSEYSLVNVSNHLDTSYTSTDDDDDQPEDQQVHDESDKNLDVSEPGRPATADKKSDVSIQSGKKESTDAEKQIEMTTQSDSKNSGLSVQSKNKLDSSTESEEKKGKAVKSEEKNSSPVQLEKDRNTSKIVKTETQKASDVTAKPQSQPASDKITKGEFQPASDKIIRAETQPAGDKIAVTENQPVSDKIVTIENQPASDKIAVTENQPAGDQTATNEATAQSASAKTVRQADSSPKKLTVPTAGIHSKDIRAGEEIKGGETAKNINAAFLESEMQTCSVNVNNNGSKKPQSKNPERTSPKSASIPKPKAQSLSPKSASKIPVETSDTVTIATPDDTNRSAVKSPK